MEALAPPFSLIRRLFRAGQLIPFLGAGASLVGRTSEDKWLADTPQFLPRANELAVDLASLSNFPSDEAIELAKVAQYFEAVAAGRTQLKNRLQAVLGGSFSPGALHELLAEQTAPLLIVTTNYDDLLERALTLANRPFDLVVHATDRTLGHAVLWRPHGASSYRRVAPNRLYIDLDTTTVLYKMHGSIARPPLESGQFVITEDDYVDFVARMVASRAIPAIITARFSQLPFLFFGYGLRDWNFRVVLSRIRRQPADGADLRSWAVQGTCTPLERAMWQQRGVTLVEMLIDDFVQQLRESP